MKGIGNKLVEMIKKLGYYILQYFYTAMYWIVRFFKVQLQKLKKGGVQKKLEKAYSGLGGEVYALHKQGATAWDTMPSVQQHLRVSEDAEADIFRVDGIIEDINNEYLRKKEEVREQYAQKRADLANRDYMGESEV